ncbi:MAG: hypothetical protein AB8E15_07385, partial [Bdellovibrionales bacterium]
RAYWMTIHQVNSMLLTGSLAICYEFLSFNSKSSIFKIKKQLLRVVLLSLAFMLVAGFGALAALSGTLFPTEDLITGIFKDFSADSHIFIRLRVSHPLLACIFGFTMIYITLNTEGNLLLRERSKNLLWLFVVALCVGFATLFLLSPTYLKLSHLAMAHILWMYFLLWVQSFVPKNRITLA